MNERALFATRRYGRVLIGLCTLALALMLGMWAYTSQANTAALSVTPNAARQDDTVTLIGEGFTPGEAISVWITYPDFRVFGVAEITASEAGSFNFPYLPDFLGATFTPTGKYTYTAFGQTSGREVYADLQVDVGAAPGGSQNVAVTATAGEDAQGSYFTLQGTGYANEMLAIWLRYPDFTVEDLGVIQADANGNFSYVLRMNGSPIGGYAFTARGLSTGLNGIGEFTLDVSDLTVAAGPAALSVSPTGMGQRNYAVFQGSGYAPGEAVSIWVTLPDFSTLAIGIVNADADGAFAAMLYLSEQEPVGLRTYTAFGNTTELRAIADYFLEPGSGPAVEAEADTGVAPEAEPTPLADAVCDGEGCMDS